MINVRILETADALAAEAARLAAVELHKALAAQQLATFVLAGGRLPPVAHMKLANSSGTQLDWSRIVFLIGDERCVPLDDPQSNWLDVLPIFEAHPEVPAQHRLRPASDLPAEAAAQAYAAALAELPRNQQQKPRLDHLWLGVGEDGHTLSLFPNHPSSADQTTDTVIAVHNSPKPPPDRISLSMSALNGARSAVVFISGASKAAVVKRIANGDHTLPIVTASQTIAKAGGHVVWLLDNEAAAEAPDITALALL